MDYIKVPTRILGTFKRSRKPYKVMLYLLYLSQIQQTRFVCVKCSTIGADIGVLPNHVCECCQKLAGAGLIAIHNRFNIFTQLSLCNNFELLFTENEPYFLFPAEYRNLNDSALLLLMALYMFAGGNAHCYPSLLQLTEATGGMRKTTIGKAIAELEQLGLIVKKNYITKDGSFGHNRYFLSKPIDKALGADKGQELRNKVATAKCLFFKEWCAIRNIIAAKSEVGQLSFAITYGSDGSCSLLPTSVPVTQEVNTITERYDIELVEHSIEKPHKTSVLKRVIGKFCTFFSHIFGRGL